MADGIRWAARVAGLLTALGLALMHAGVGPAAACAGMSGMSGTGLMGSTGGMAGMSNAVDASAHHEPASGEHPSAGHAAMCVSTPATSHPTTTKAGPADVGVLLRGVTPALRPTSAPSTGSSAREPPTPDLVAELCVQRV